MSLYTGGASGLDKRSRARARPMREAQTLDEGLVPSDLDESAAVAACGAPPSRTPSRPPRAPRSRCPTAAARASRPTCGRRLPPPHQAEQALSRLPPHHQQARG